MTNEIKPCPFCGDEAHIEDGRNDRPWLVECPNRDCHVQPFMDHADTRSQAVKAWNTRAGEPANIVSTAVSELQAEVERLTNAIEKICIESNSDWAKVRDEPRAQIDVIHNIAMDAFFYKHALAQKEPVE